MHYRKLFARRVPGLCLAMAALALGLLLSAFFPSARAAEEEYAVTGSETEGYSATVNGEQITVYPVFLQTQPEVQSWTIAQVTADGNVYTDGSSYYIPERLEDTLMELQVTIHNDGYYLALDGEEDVEFLTAVDYSAGTDLTYTNPRSEGGSEGFPYTFYIATPTLEGWSAPDENNVVYADGEYYQMSDDGITFAQVSTILLRIENPMVDDFEAGQLYEQGILDGNSLYGGRFLPGRLELTLAGDYVFTADNKPQVTDYQNDLAYVEFPDERTLVLDSSDWTNVTSVTITGLSVMSPTEDLVELRMEGVPRGSISAEGLSNLRFTMVDGNYAYGDFFPGTTITLKTEGDYRFGDNTSWGHEYSGVTFNKVDNQTITIDTEDTITGSYGEATQVVLNMDIRSAITVNFAFEPSGYASVLVDYEEVTSVQWPQGVDMDISLDVDSGLFKVDDLQTAITGATVSAAETGEVAGEPLDLDLTVDQYGDAVLPGYALTGDCTITFTVEESAFTRLVTVPETRGEGYVLSCERGAVPGEPGYISLILAVDPAYIDATPVLTPPEGWSISYMGNELNLWYITMDYGDGETDQVPYEPMELTVGVSGIVPDNPSGGGGGGGSSGGSKEEIRVENQLNQEGASSDTKLWPNGTKEQNGVSTTTVTDKELEALINLAQQHIEDIKELEGDGYKEGIIVIEDLRPSSSIHTYILKLTESQFQRIAEEEWDRFTVQTPAGSLSLYGETIREVAGLEGAVDFTISRLEYEGRPGVDVTLTVDGKPVTAFSEVYGIRAFVPYAPAEEEDVNALLMDYIHEDGTAERVTESFYDKTAGGVYVFTNHLSKFGVAYRPTVYTDVGADHWASPYVTFLAARGLLDSGSTFRPDDKATRGELLELLGEALSAANLPSRAVQVYSDVPASSSVAKAASWAYYNNLTGSITSGGKLRPNEAITREDMAALVGNVSTGVGLRLRSKGLDTGYTDLGDVASYARASVTRLRAAGILEMADNYKFSPAATLNRGEMAQIVANLLSSL